MDLHYQTKMLQNTLRHPNSTRSFMNQMKKYYFKQALTQLSIDFLIKQLKLEDTPQIIRDYFKYMNDVLIVTRNEEWMSNIIPMIHEDCSLIAVGTLHLIGPDGLIIYCPLIFINVKQENQQCTQHHNTAARQDTWR